MQTIILAIVITLIVSLSHSLKISGHFDKIVDSFKYFITSHRKSIFILPALIGLLPMPGGAIFSAPMVSEVSRDTQLSPGLKAASNHWFRHVWEYIWPLYPGVLLTAEITALSLIIIIVANVPFTIIAICAGFIFVAKKGRFASAAKSEDSETVTWKTMFVTVFPILIVIVCFIGLRLLLMLTVHLFFISCAPLLFPLPGAGLIPFSVPSYIENSLLIPSICAGILFMLIEYPKITVKDVFNNKRIPSLVLMIVSLLLFQDILKSGNAVDKLMALFIDWNIPLWGLAALLPFITGLVTGITVGYVACSFPIITQIVIQTGNGSLLLPYIVLAFVFGFMGVMLSPLHVCMVLTAKHFNVPLGEIIKRILVPALTLLVSSIVFFMILYYVMG
jgi:hypothetical protein